MPESLSSRIRRAIMSAPLSRRARRTQLASTSGTHAPAQQGETTGSVTVNGRDNQIDCQQERLPPGSKIEVTGNDNVVFVDPKARIDGLQITITGDGNHVELHAALLAPLIVVLRGSANSIRIGSGSTICGLVIGIEDDRNRVHLDEHVKVEGGTELYAMEGTAIEIGTDCLFSGGVHFRTGDSHSVVDSNGNRINPSLDIRLGKHVWVGRAVTALKGTEISDHSIVGANSLVTKRFTTTHCVVAGNPARVVKEGVDWSVERIPMKHD